MSLFENLSRRFTGIFDRLQQRKALSTHDIEQAMRDIRVALLEADVALPVVKALTEKITTEATGEHVVKNISSGQMVVKIVHDALVDILGGENQAEWPIPSNRPAVMMMVGLQGSGKTTTTAKLAKYWTKQGYRTLVASVDTYRPAAQDQLNILAQQHHIPALDIVLHEKPLDITRRALKKATAEGFDIVLLDTAGRLHLDQPLMEELQQIKSLCTPHGIFLVVDAMIGQTAYEVADSFNRALSIDGVVLTRLDGDARGGAALSIRHMTGCPIVWAGVGEKMDDLQPFHPNRMANRILGMGDIVSLVEKASEIIEKDEADKLAAKFVKNEFDFEDMLDQFKRLQKMGGVTQLLGLLPGGDRLKQNIAQSKLGGDKIKRFQAMIQSMTVEERRKPHLIKASRKMRIAKGAGVSQHDVDKLLKQRDEMLRTMKKMNKLRESGQFPMDGDMSNLLGGS